MCIRDSLLDNSEDIYRIKRQNCNFDERINEIEIRCNNVQRQTIETVNESFNSKINNLENRIDKINETVNETIQRQIESQSRKEMCIRDS